MARVKQVFSSQEKLANAWLLQTHKTGRCKSWYSKEPAMHFTGRTIYSGKGLDWPVATMPEVGLVLVNNDKSSMRVNSYRRPAIRFNALRLSFNVFNIPGEALFKKPVEILPYLIEKHVNAMMCAKRSRSNFEWRMQQVDSCAREASNYAKIYNLELSLDKGEQEVLVNRLKYRLAKVNAYGMAQMMGRG